MFLRPHADAVVGVKGRTCRISPQVLSLPTSGSLKDIELRSLGSERLVETHSPSMQACWTYYRDAKIEALHA
jgi:hypothetical protein